MLYAQVVETFQYAVLSWTDVSWFCLNVYLRFNTWHKSQIHVSIWISTCMGSFTVIRNRNSWLYRFRFHNSYTVVPRYESVFFPRWQSGDYPHHFLEACGREWENRTTSERKRKGRHSHWPRGTMSASHYESAGLITGEYCISVL